MHLIASFIRATLFEGRHADVIGLIRDIERAFLAAAAGFDVGRNAIRDKSGLIVGVRLDDVHPFLKGVDGMLTEPLGGAEGPGLTQFLNVDKETGEARPRIQMLLGGGDLFAETPEKTPEEVRASNENIIAGLPGLFLDMAEPSPILYHEIHHILNARKIDPKKLAMMAFDAPSLGEMNPHVAKPPRPYETRLSLKQPRRPKGREGWRGRRWGANIVEDYPFVGNIIWEIVSEMHADPRTWLRTYPTAQSLVDKYRWQLIGAFDDAGANTNPRRTIKVLADIWMGVRNEAQGLVGG